MAISLGRTEPQTLTGVKPADPSPSPDVFDHTAMEDEQGRAGGDTHPDGCERSQRMDGAGTPFDCLGAEGGRPAQGVEGPLQVPRDGGGHSTKTHPRTTDADDPRQCAGHSGRSGAVWPVQGIPLLRGALQLFGMGNRGDQDGLPDLVRLAQNLVQGHQDPESTAVTSPSGGSQPRRAQAVATPR